MNIPEFAKNDENHHLTAKLQQVHIGGYIFKRSKYFKKW
jgi:hypothetical protein